MKKQKTTQKVLACDGFCLSCFKYNHHHYDYYDYFNFMFSILINSDVFLGVSAQRTSRYIINILLQQLINITLNKSDEQCHVVQSCEPHMAVGGGSKKKFYRETNKFRKRKQSQTQWFPIGVCSFSPRSRSFWKTLGRQCDTPKK